MAEGDSSSDARPGGAYQTDGEKLIAEVIERINETLRNREPVAEPAPDSG